MIRPTYPKPNVVLVFAWKATTRIAIELVIVTRLELWHEALRIFSKIINATACTKNLASKLPEQRHHRLQKRNKSVA